MSHGAASTGRHRPVGGGHRHPRRRGRGPDRPAARRAPAGLARPAVRPVRPGRRTAPSSWPCAPSSPSRPASSSAIVEQLYTFGDAGRDAPLADLGRRRGQRERLGRLSGPDPDAVDAARPTPHWTPVVDVLPLGGLARRPPPPASTTACSRPDALGRRRRRPPRPGRGCCSPWTARRWNEERVLERYELLYEAGLVAEAARDRDSRPADRPRRRPPWASRWSPTTAASWPPAWAGCAAS